MTTPTAKAMEAARRGSRDSPDRHVHPGDAMTAPKSMRELIANFVAASLIPGTPGYRMALADLTALVSEAVRRATKEAVHTYWGGMALERIEEAVLAAVMGDGKP